MTVKIVAEVIQNLNLALLSQATCHTTIRRGHCGTDFPYVSRHAGTRNYLLHVANSRTRRNKNQNAILPA